MNKTNQDVRAANRQFLMDRAAQSDNRRDTRLNREQEQLDRDRRPVAPRRVSLAEAEANLRAAKDGAESRHALRDYFRARAAERDGHDQ